MADEDIHRLHTHNCRLKVYREAKSFVDRFAVEIGATEAVQRHYSRHVVANKPVSQRKLDFKHQRPRWMRECVAEATGVFYYVFPGIAAIASITLNLENEVGVTAFGSLFQIGWNFAIGIAFAIITCAPISGGHFIPPEIQAFTAESIAAGKGLVYNGGPASILCTFPNPNQTNLGYLFLTEFFVDSFVGLVIWANLDPANLFVSPVSAPFAIGLAYATMVWGFADIAISTNLARDLGTHIVAAIFFGGEAFSCLKYSWIAILVNVPATIFATGYYKFLMRDSLGSIAKGHAVYEHGEE
ncbi:MAG: hypothetical protein L6R42_001218, partial [Xanthoria sp. 1 TBL-2021]